MNKIYKAVLAAAAIVTVSTATIAPVNVFAQGDSANGRPSYTISDINNGKLGDKITFNSISEGGKIGNEKNFVSAKSSASDAEWGFNELNVKDGEVYTILLYVHNNNPNGTNKIAKDVKATFAIPEAAATSHTIVGYLESSNATPNRYWDEVVLKSDGLTSLEYVEGSAKYTNAKLGTVALSDDVIISGATLGYDKLNGEIPGCYEYSGTVSIQVRVRKSVSSELNKTVRIKGTTEWSESVTAKIGDEVEYKIDYKNMLSEMATDVMILDTLPEDLEYVAGSTRLYDALNNGTVVKDTITTTGINIGNYDPESNASIVFTAKVVDKDLKCGNNQIINWVSNAVNGKEAVVAKDDASVMVEKTGAVCEDPTPTPPTPTPKKIPDTGAGTIIISAVGAGAIVTSLGYYVASRKKLMK